MNRRSIGQLWSWGVMIVLLGGPAAQADQAERRVSVAIPLPAHTIEGTDSGRLVHMEGFGVLREPGAPQLPVRIFPIAIPPGAEVVRVSYTAADPVALPLRDAVVPAPIWEPIGHEKRQARAAEQQRFDATYAAIYGTDEPYPAAPVQFLRTASYRGYDLVDIQVTPLAHRPLSGQLLRYTDITVHVDYRLPEQRSMPVRESSPAVEASARDLILNYDQASPWYAGQEPRGSDHYEFVVITLEELVDAIAPLVTWEQQKGRSVQVVTTQWIAGNYTGVDLAAQIRNFLREKFSADAWGIEHVLLVGHYYDLPMRQVWQDLGYGRPFTDTYYAELSLPDDQSWDKDGDGNYAEDDDEIDFYTEVSVGRIPWSNPAVVQHIAEKSIQFEQDLDPTYKQNILLAGSFFWPDTDTAVLMEAIAALPHLADWTDHRMYEVGYSTYPMDNDISHARFVSEWSGNKYAVVSWAGHGGPFVAARYYYGAPEFINSDDCAVLDDDHPSIVFADSCYTSIPPANLGREMLHHGAVGYVGATQVAGGRRGWQTPADGSSQTLNYLFTGHVTSGIYTQGEALQLALRQTYLQAAWRWPKYELLEWGALYGNPDLGVSSTPALHIQFPDGLPGHVMPDVETRFAVRIDAVQDTLIVDSATLHYRADGGTFQATPLNWLGDKRYQAVLPPTDCDEVPEFYVSAAGVRSGTVSRPANAPDEFFTSAVGTFAAIFHDDFEQDRGWLVDSPSAADGNWERGVPVNDPSWPYDPFSDADGSGQCYLTANRFGDSDVDAGSVRLISPLVSMIMEDVTLRYSYYLYADDQTDVDYLLVEVSSNDLAGPWQELARYIRNNGLSWRTDSFSAAELQALGIDLTGRMRVRFTAHDGGSGSIVEAGVDAFEIQRFSCLSGPAVPAGRVPADSFTPGPPVTLDKVSGGRITLDWNASCVLTDLDYAVYEGAIGSFASHVPVLCTTGGATTAAITPGGADHYYLVVPLSTNREGSYGMDGTGNERPPGASHCLAQERGDCS
jgi:hypothetical protein